MMGVAMLMVMFFHHTSFVDFGEFGNHLSSYGEWGVDFFIFLSGYGIFHSLDKAGLNHSSLVQFYKRRLWRIMPACLLSGWILGTFTTQYTDPDMLPLQFCGLDKWYIRTILLLYAASPLLFYLVKGRYSTIGVAGVSVGCLFYACGYYCLAFSSIGPYEHFHLFRTVVLTVLKIPAFVLGMYMYAFLQTKRKISLTSLILVPALSVGLLITLNVIASKSHFIAFCSTFFLSAYITIPLFCVICYGLTRILPIVGKTALAWIGGFSLEIYLMHERLFKVLGKALEIHPVIRVAIMFACSFVAAYLLKHLSTLFVAMCQKVCTYCTCKH